ncbi:hypothetical protein B0O99DRAFT_484806, partial [Bisporella sp. PMI_857]
TTAYFYRDGSWVTPRAESGAKIGVSRRWALENSSVMEGTIMVDDVKDREMIWV